MGAVQSAKLLQKKVLKNSWKLQAVLINSIDHRHGISTFDISALNPVRWANDNLHCSARPLFLY